MATAISPNFTLEEFYANSSTARALHIDNTPSPIIEGNIWALVNRVLQPIRDAYGKPITVTCGYRCNSLNKAVGGSSSSQHLQGAAADIKASRTTNAELFYLILGMIDRREIEVGQLIWEYGDMNEPKWIHVSLPYNKKNDIRKAVKVNGKTQYPEFR